MRYLGTILRRCSGGYYAPVLAASIEKNAPAGNSITYLPDMYGNLSGNFKATNDLPSPLKPSNYPESLSTPLLPHVMLQQPDKDLELAHIDHDIKEATEKDLSDLVSPDADMSFSRTLRAHWKAMVYCVAVGICAMGDGYQFKMPGNIVALRGFIDQMGYPNAAGVKVLNPQHVAAWGGESIECHSG